MIPICIVKLLEIRFQTFFLSRTGIETRNIVVENCMLLKNSYYYFYMYFDKMCWDCSTILIYNYRLNTLYITCLLEWKFIYKQSEPIKNWHVPLLLWVSCLRTRQIDYIMWAQTSE